LRDAHTILLGRERGQISAKMATLAQLSADEKRTLGRGLNLMKRCLTEIFEGRQRELESAADSGSKLDVTLPGRKPWVGHRHPLAQVYDDLLDLFHGLGYSVFTSPEVEHDEYNFGKLNFGADHPARDAH